MKKLNLALLSVLFASVLASFSIDARHCGTSCRTRCKETCAPKVRCYTVHTYRKYHCPEKQCYYVCPPGTEQEGYEGVEE